jgi:DedD protein
MAERIADNAELLVDEMKRKARRRLVGAIVLALAAAIVLPMLLEKEPRPLGDDVSVQIPPVDQGKFVNRLTGKTGEVKAPPKMESKPIALAPGKSEAKADVPVESAPLPGTVAQKAESSVAAAPEEKSDPKGEVKGEPKGESKNEPKAEVKAVPKADGKATTPSEPAGESKVAVATASSAAAPKPDGFVVQLAAFADDKGANALANKLKKSGYAAYVEPINTSRGTLWRVRVGGYGSRPEADAARVALKGEGYSGIIAPSQ